MTKNVSLLALLKVLDRNNSYVDITWNNGHNNYIAPIYRVISDWENKGDCNVTNIVVLPSGVLALTVDYKD